MNLFSLYVPGTSPLHRLPIGYKYLLLLVLTVPALLVGNPVVSLAALVVSLALLATCRTGLRHAWTLPLALWVLVAFLAGYQVLIGRPDLGFVVGANLLTAVYASRILTLTTPGPALIDALVAALRPLERFGVKPDLVGLAVAIMVRSRPAPARLLRPGAPGRTGARTRAQPVPAGDSGGGARGGPGAGDRRSPCGPRTGRVVEWGP